MLFLAVFCGFFAEYQLEHKIEKDREKEFAKTLSPSVKRTTDEERLKLHVAGVVVNNFTNHLYTLTADYCADEKINFGLLLTEMKKSVMC